MDINKIEESFKETSDKKCAFATGGMVSTAFPEATKAGVKMLELGGNAVDAACAAAFALGVCEPQASGIGGQSMAMLHIKGETISVDGSSRVPSLAHLSILKKDDLLFGHKATTVPSTVALLGYLNFHYGRLDWKTILAPAIKIAKKGYKITKLQSDLQKRELDNFLNAKSKSGAKYFLKNGKKAYEPGELFVQPDLANTLSRIAKYGPKSFYLGKIASMIHEDMRKNDGFLTKEDLALIPWPIVREPIKCKYRGLSILTPPPPAAGRTMSLVLMMLNCLPSKFIKEESPESYHFIAETFRKAFMNRKQRPFDPNTYPQLPDKVLSSHKFARTLSKSIRNKIDKSLPLIDPNYDEDTTHLSVIDAEGNAVGITQSVERVYGSKVAAEGLGFVYNNYMSALETKNPEHNFYLRPNAIPWTLVSPAIVLYKDKIWMVTGSPGSERIFSTISQFISNIVDKNMSIGDAMYHPRLHCSIGGTVSLEKERFDPEVVKYLKSMGYKVVDKGPYAFYLGAIHTAIKCHSTIGFQGVAEVRRDGVSAGPDLNKIKRVSLENIEKGEESQYEKIPGTPISSSRRK